jgi:hypothetical protein
LRAAWDHSHFAKSAPPTSQTLFSHAHTCRPMLAARAVTARVLYIQLKQSQPQAAETHVHDTWSIPINKLAVLKFKLFISVVVTQQYTTGDKIYESQEHVC